MHVHTLLNNPLDLEIVSSLKIICLCNPSESLFADKGKPAKCPGGGGGGKELLVLEYTCDRY